MSKPSKKELFEHVQRFVREVFAQRLKEAGFVSYMNEDIHWYRIVNGNVIHAIYFVTRHTSLNVSLSIEYGCHPLFIPPVFQKSPYVFAMPGYEQMYHVVPEWKKGSGMNGMMGTAITGMINRPYRFPDVLVLCPQDDHKGLDILEQVLSVMDQITTPKACFEAHKQWRKNQIENGIVNTMSTYFVDEVLYWEEEDLYPFCISYVDLFSQALEKKKQEGQLTRKEDLAELERLQLLKRTFQNGAREAYLQVLRNREKYTLRCLDRHTTR